MRSAVFFLSVTAFMCLVLDHLLCPASAGCVLESERRHCWQTKGPVRDCLGATCDLELLTRPRSCRTARVVAIGAFSLQNGGLLEVDK